MTTVKVVQVVQEVVVLDFMELPAANTEKAAKPATAEAVAVGMKSSHAGHLVVLVVVVPKMLATGWRAMGALTLMPVAK
ncbi:MAG TPA: hypothetical protein IAC59_10200 [Candidatus Fimadaptatus faecigallinarum]|uniref:Uncharacterized protein n=1 Tax=Candidatus Fimadaptatus faecigallinarum TaxID=2840814 RepID=A0A9D1LT58_9FIRM|nr:hypothetical protein [Candidatus Fimadaptatus faecigallinarum]